MLHRERWPCRAEHRCRAGPGRSRAHFREDQGRPCGGPGRSVPPVCSVLLLSGDQLACTGQGAGACCMTLYAPQTLIPQIGGGTKRAPLAAHSSAECCRWCLRSEQLPSAWGPRRQARPGAHWQTCRDPLTPSSGRRHTLHFCTSLYTHQLCGSACRLALGVLKLLKLLRRPWVGVPCRWPTWGESTAATFRACTGGHKVLLLSPWHQFAARVGPASTLIGHQEASSSAATTAAAAAHEQAGSIT